MTLPTPREDMFPIYGPESKFHDSALFFSTNLDASTATGSSSALSRSSSTSSIHSMDKISTDRLSEYKGFNAVVSSGLACSLGPMLLPRGRYFDRLPSVSYAFVIGCLTSSTKVLLRNTPVVGDLSSIAVYATIQRSRMHRSGEVSPRLLTANVCGFAGSLIGLRIADMIQNRRGDREWINLIISVSCSFAGNYLGRNLADFYYSNK